MADVEQRFFCHQCSAEIPRISADFTCPTCNSGFIEELSQDQHHQPNQRAEDFDDDEPYDLGQVLGPLEQLLPGLLGGGGGTRAFGGGLGGPMRPARRIRIGRGAAGRHGGGVAGPQNLGMDQAALETALQDFIVNLAGVDVGVGGGQGAQFHFIRSGAGPLGGAGGGFHLHGNPGDYAWGRGGLDAIITQLLNHMDGAGPPPMAKENIQEIPTVKISKKQMEKSQSCSVCWEDFKEDEEVKLLECEHCFHAPCIIPWLELHGTCPVCRKELGRNKDAGENVADDSNETQDVNNDISFSQHVSSSSQNVPTGEHIQSNPSTSGVSTSESAPAAGGGGLAGLLQSALNQAFSLNWSSQPPQQDSRSTPSETVIQNNSDDTNSSNQNQPPESNRAASAARRDAAEPQSSISDDDTPATRRQRLDSEFVDLDCD